jgi:predicted amidohydrolase
LTLAAAQLGPIARDASRESVVRRLVSLLERAAGHGCRLVVFPEMALTTFFPRWLIEDEDEVAGFFESAMPNAQVAPLFETAARLGTGFTLGYCEQVGAGDTMRRYNTAILVDAGGNIAGKYRKVHVPGNPEFDPALGLQHLEPWYFDDGDLGFPVFDCLDTRIGMLICNDRRWPEPWRVLALQGAELVLLGYNSPAQLPDYPRQNALRTDHHQLPMRAAAYQNGLWIVASAKAGHEEGCDMMGGSCIISPSSEVVAVSSTLDDELVVYTADLGLAGEYRDFFDMSRCRRPETYGLICDRRGEGDPLTAEEWARRLRHPAGRDPGT